MSRLLKFRNQKNAGYFLAGIFFFLLAFTLPAFALSFKKSSRDRDPASMVETPQYRILFSYDQDSSREDEQNPKTKWVEFSYKYVDLEEPPGQRFAGQGGGRIRFLDKDGFALASDVFSLQDLEMGDLYGFLWVEESRVRQIVSADAILLRPEEVRLLKKGDKAGLQRITEVPNLEDPESSETTNPEASPETQVSPAAENTEVPVPAVSVEPSPSPSPSASPLVEAPLFPPAPDQPAPESPKPGEEPSPAASVLETSPDAEVSPLPSSDPTPSPEISTAAPLDAAVAESSPSPSPSPEELEHAGVGNEELRKILATQEKARGLGGTVPPPPQSDSNSEGDLSGAPPPLEGEEAKEDDKNGVIMKQTFL